jgi:ATP-dependent exoDNAse (exonuclease V) alpha subunit
VPVLSRPPPTPPSHPPATRPQVLSPVKRGPAGVAALNARLQPVVNPPDPASRAEMPLSPNALANAAAAAAAAAAGLPPPAWRVGDRVVQMTNDYDRATWNGDLGYIAAVDPARRQLTVRYPAAPGGAGSPGSGPAGGSGSNSGGSGAAGGGGGVVAAGGARFVLYSGREVAEQLSLAWATTVHKVRPGRLV